MSLYSQFRLFAHPKLAQTANSEWKTYFFPNFGTPVFDIFVWPTEFKLTPLGNPQHRRYKNDSIIQFGKKLNHKLTNHLWRSTQVHLISIMQLWLKFIKYNKICICECILQTLLKNFWEKSYSLWCGYNEIIGLG